MQAALQLACMTTLLPELPHFACSSLCMLCRTTRPHAQAALPSLPLAGSSPPPAVRQQSSRRRRWQLQRLPPLPLPPSCWQRRRHSSRRGSR